MSNCPFCGSSKVSKTFNFNEYTCDLCECDYKHLSSGIKIFQEGSWAKFCGSITEAVSSKVEGANVVDLISKVMRGYSKGSPNDIDVMIESLTSIAGTLSSEMKVKLRGKNDFIVVMEQIDTVVRAAQTLHKRQNDLGIKVRLNEGILDWFKGEAEQEPATDYPDDTDEVEMRRKMNAAAAAKSQAGVAGASPVEEGAMSDLDIIAQEAAEALGAAGEVQDEDIIAYVQQNHPDEIEHVNLIVQAVHDHVSGGVEESAPGASPVEEGAMSDLDIIAQEAAEALGAAGEVQDEDIIAYVQQNHPDEIEHVNLIVQAVHDHVSGGVEESAPGAEVIDELVPIYKLEKLDDPNAKPDLGIEAGDEVSDEDGEIEVKLGEDEDPFAADAGAGGEAAPAEGGADAGGDAGADPFAAEGGDAGGDAAAPAEGGDEAGSDPFAADGGDAGADAGGEEDAIANVQDAAETVQDKFKRLETKIDDLLTAVTGLTGEESAEGGTEDAPAEGGDEAGSDPFASEGGDAEAAPAEGGDAAPAGDDPFAEAYLRTFAEAKKKDVRGKREFLTKRGENTVGAYHRKADSTATRAEAEKSGDALQTDMTAEETEEKIPFTEEPKELMDKDTESNGPGATKKPTGKVAYREGFNGFRVGDEVLVEKSVDTWNILTINKNIFTLGRGKTTTKIDIFTESIRHADSKLEWQATTELMGESKRRWASVAANYVTEGETQVTGVVGLGGGNRLGGQKFGAEDLATDKIGTVGSSAADRKDIYKYIKDNALHRCAREVAIQRVCERFTNPLEEINNIVDDAVLSEDTTQVEQIDSQYSYRSAPIGEHALRQAFQRGWKSVNESEAKEVKPVKKMVESVKATSYRTAEDALIDGLGRTAADRLSGR